MMSVLQLPTTSKMFCFPFLNISRKFENDRLNNNDGVVRNKTSYHNVNYEYMPYLLACVNIKICHNNFLILTLLCMVPKTVNNRQFGPTSVKNWRQKPSRFWRKHVPCIGRKCGVILSFATNRSYLLSG